MLFVQGTYLRPGGLSLWRPFGPEVPQEMRLSNRRNAALVILVMVAVLSGSAAAQSFVDVHQDHSNRTWILLTAVGSVAAGLDVGQTAHDKTSWGKDFHEDDALARPLVLLPNPAYISIAASGIIGLDYMANRMRKSGHFPRTWWVPQAVQIALNVTGFSYTLARRR